MGSTFDFWSFGDFLILCYKLHPGTDVLNSPDAQRKPSMDSLCLLVDLCQTHCVPSVNLSRECFLSAAYTRLKGNGRQAWPLTRANPVNQHSATLAASPPSDQDRRLRRKLGLKGCNEGNKNSILPSQIAGWPSRDKNKPLNPCADPARSPLVRLVLPNVSLQMAAYLEYFGEPPWCVFTAYLSS